MAFQLGVGELTMHHRFRVSTPAKPMSCGTRSGCVTGVLAEVTCTKCVQVTRRAERLAEACGCRRGDIHEAVARAQIEIADGHDKGEERKVLE